MSKDAEITAIFGGRGSGKSTQALWLTRSARRLVVFDPMDEYREQGVRSLPTLAALKAALVSAWGGDFRLAYVPPLGREGEALSHLCDFLCIAQRPYFENRDPRKLTLLVEEIDTAYPSNQDRRHIGFTRAVRRGRHFGIEIVGVTQRPAQVSPTFRSNAGSTYVFPLAYADDINAMLQLTGRDHAEALRRLGNRAFLHVRDGKVQAGKTRKK